MDTSSTQPTPWRQQEGRVVSRRAIRSKEVGHDRVFLPDGGTSHP